MEWMGYVPTFPINKFELVECNAGLQVCSGGCNHCVNVTGSFIAKSCSGDYDQGLDILGMHTDGCKNITSDQNQNYTKWINKMIGKLPNYSISADFTEACRCSYDGCNGPFTSDEDNDEGIFRSSFVSSLGIKSVKSELRMLFILVFVSITIC